MTSKQIDVCIANMRPVLASGCSRETFLRQLRQYLRMQANELSARRKQEQFARWRQIEREDVQQLAKLADDGGIACCSIPAILS